MAAEFGIEVYGADSLKVLGMEDFTIRKIFEAEVPAKPYQQSSEWADNIRTDTINFTVPGYHPDSCFVVITPKNYIQTEQGSAVGPFTPYYKELGGEVIGIVTYLQEEWYNPSWGSGRWVKRWREYTMACTIEVYKVF